MVTKPLIIGFKHLFRRPVTVQYPFEKFKVSKQYRGVPAVNFDTCTSCERCIDICPNKCTVMEEYNGKKIPNLFAARCMFCNLCIEACPTGSRTNTPVYELAEYSREATLFSPEALTDLVDKSFPELKYSGPINAPIIDEQICVDCLQCREVCPEDAISTVDKGKKRTFNLNFDKCTSCGSCIEACPSQALTYARVVVEKGDELEWTKFLINKPSEFENYFKLLHKKVIKPGWCSHCTACVLACPVERIIGDPNEPIDENLDIQCTDCGVCVRVCPRFDYNNPKEQGDFVEAYSSGSTRYKGQDGAMVTEVFVTAMEMGIIDTAIVVGADENWVPYLRIARNPYEITHGLKTKWGFADILSAMKAASKISKKGIGIVGVPCQIEGYDYLKEFYNPVIEKVKLVVGIFCFENFYYQRFYKEFLEEKEGIKTTDITKADIKTGKLTVTLNSGEQHQWKIADLGEYAAPGCHMCQHFTGMTADVSMGGSGSSHGFTSVFVRKDNAKKILDHSREKGYIQLASDEKNEAILKTNKFMIGLKIKTNQKHFNHYLEDRGIKVETEEGTDGS